MTDRPTDRQTDRHTGPTYICTSRRIKNVLFTHCRNIHGITPRVATHVVETAVFALISSSAVVQVHSPED